MENLFEISETGFAVKKGAKPTSQQWAECGPGLARIEKCLGFIIGDWVNYGETAYGEKYREAVAMTGLNYKTVKSYAWVAKAVKMSVRTDKLHFEHYVKLARLEPEQQAKWVKLCVDESKKGGYVGTRQLSRSIDAGRLVAIDEFPERNHATAIITHVLQITRLGAFWANAKAAGLDTYNHEQVEAFCADFQRLENIRLEMVEAGWWPQPPVTTQFNPPI